MNTDDAIIWAISVDSADDFQCVHVDDYLALKAKCKELEDLRDGLTQFYAGAAIDARRYRWIRALGGSWETEAFLSGLSPEGYDAAIDLALYSADEKKP